jgi:hypothetical protein
MPRLTTLSNPTGITDLDKKCVSILVDDQVKKSTYSLVRLELGATKLPADTRVVVIARRGNSEVRTVHGPLSAYDKGLIDVSDLSTDGVWVFRVLFVSPNSAKLLASVENIRPGGLGNSDSLIALEAADLGQVPWELRVLEQEGRAIIRFNRDVYASPASVEADPHFACLVYPEAIRQLAQWHTRDPATLDEPHWEPFKAYIAMLGVAAELTESDEDKENWCREVVASFCGRSRSADQLRQLVRGGVDE